MVLQKISKKVYKARTNAGHPIKIVKRDDGWIWHYETLQDVAFIYNRPFVMSTTTTLQAARADILSKQKVVKHQ